MRSRSATTKRRLPKIFFDLPNSRHAKLVYFAA
jgi:hypothetical protein